jgi:hypothetical protein
MEIGNIDNLRKFFQTIILVVALLALCKGGMQLFNVYQTYQWSSTEGVITSSSLGGSTGGKPLYWPQIKYRFYISGREYASNRYSIAETFSYAKQRPYEIVEKHQVGSKTQVFYNPKAPSEAVIERFPWESPIPLFVGIVLFIFGLYIWPRLTRQLRPTP